MATAGMQVTAKIRLLEDPADSLRLAQVPSLSSLSRLQALALFVPPRVSDLTRPHVHRS